MVGIVVDQQDGFGSKRLAVGMRNGRENIGLFEGSDKFFAVGAEGSDGLVPSLGIGGFGGLGPVAAGEVGRFVFGIDGVFDDVRLCDAEVLDELVGGVGEGVGALAAKLGGEILYGGVKTGVGVVFGEEGEQFFAESIRLFCWSWLHLSVLSER